MVIRVVNPQGLDAHIKKGSPSEVDYDPYGSCNHSHSLLQYG
jgi:hypothetical protein